MQSITEAVSLFIKFTGTGNLSNKYSFQNSNNGGGSFLSHFKKLKLAPIKVYLQTCNDFSLYVTVIKVRCTFESAAKTDSENGTLNFCIAKQAVIFFYHHTALAQMNELVREVSSTLPTSRSCLCWSNKDFLPFLGYQLLSAWHIRTCSCNLFDQQMINNKRAVEMTKLGIHTLYKNAAARVNYCDSLPLVNLICDAQGNVRSHCSLHGVATSKIN
jgi:hypothetical protein